MVLRLEAADEKNVALALEIKALQDGIAIGIVRRRYGRAVADHGRFAPVALAVVILNRARVGHQARGKLLGKSLKAAIAVGDAARAQDGDFHGEFVLTSAAKAFCS